MLKVLEPCGRVELRVDGVDDPWVLVASWCLLDLEEDEANHWAWGWDWCSVRRLPSDGDEVAVGLDGELLEIDRGLLALTDHELLAVGERSREERYWAGLGCFALRAGVD